MSFLIEKEFCQICNSPLKEELCNNYSCSKAPHYFTSFHKEHEKEIRTYLFIVNSFYILFEDMYENNSFERIITLYNNYSQIYKVNCSNKSLSMTDILNIVKFL